MKESDQEQFFIDSARREYGDDYDRLKWVSPGRAAVASEERESLLLFLESRGTRFHCGGTKPACFELSPGCKKCAAGEWSCLFINGVCNGTCFFCPADQTEMGEPTTQTLRFTDPEDYADYIEKFQFKGVSMSGGEPLMSFERTISFIEAVRNRLDADIHLWMYTNGRLVTREKLQALKEAGLDEIRFNIYTHSGCLETIRLAAGLIANVTVEVPAIPEEFEELKKTLPMLRQAGVKFMNLHQLRLTPHNFSRLAKRDYTYLHGPRVTVLESELTALKIMRYNLEAGINLPINYCSFPYKNRYQKSAERKRHAPWVMNPYEDMTESGLIRSLYIKGSATHIKDQVKALREAGIQGNSWKLAGTGDCLSLSRECWPHIDFRNFALFVRYHETAIRPSVSYRNMFREIRLNDRKKVVIERWPICDEIELKQDDILRCGRDCLGITINEAIIDRIQSSSNEAASFEIIPQGLSLYF